ncbi:hypothetical protein LOTGIDRAFT_232678 [Lottia gigantea]|uniref:Uncharacterized protein n=1 Tax=Lottia gigantea TaxID=225164 RepID=V4AIE1_LOTGI|nr:hypothetical protein LOTGIDRAFT_232678 [Lottia gigantea]ESO93226.1 hypothetical protein LOTGIDRAFT_232678 [Lottia gigantea]
MTMFQRRIRLDDALTLPPFKNSKSLREIHLLQNTIYCRDGKQRLPTPDKLAIMELSTSFQKRRLGKQQRILTDITKRCREQDISDLSDALSTKCKLKADREKKHIITKRPLSDPSPNSRTETAYKSFPVRRIFKKTRYDLNQRQLHHKQPRNLNSGFHTVRSSRTCVDGSQGSPTKTGDLWAEPTFCSKPLEAERKTRNKTDPCITLKSTNGTTRENTTTDIYSDTRQH